LSKLIKLPTKNIINNENVTDIFEVSESAEIKSIN